MSSRISKIARKSVVVVADKEDSDAYCSGCVVIKDRIVKVIAPHQFVMEKGVMRLKVVFFDKTELDVTAVTAGEPFCLLTTAFHPACEKIRLLEDERGIAGPQATFMFGPQSFVTSRRYCTYVTVESLQSYADIVTDLRANSSNYFLVSCDYFEKTQDGINRLSAAPVFTMSGKTAGIVLQDCRFEKKDPARELKVAIKATHLRELMMVLHAEL